MLYERTKGPDDSVSSKKIVFPPKCIPSTVFTLKREEVAHGAIYQGTLCDTRMQLGKENNCGDFRRTVAVLVVQIPIWICPVAATGKAVPEQCNPSIFRCHCRHLLQGENHQGGRVSVRVSVPIPSPANPLAKFGLQPFERASQLSLESWISRQNRTDIRSGPFIRSTF